MFPAVLPLPYFFVSPESAARIRFFSVLLLGLTPGRLEEPEGCVGAAAGAGLAAAFFACRAACAPVREPERAAAALRQAPEPAREQAPEQEPAVPPPAA